MRADPITEPGAALAKVLAKMILACLIASGGKSAKVVRAKSRASAKASGAASWAREVITPKVPAASTLLSTVRRVVFKSLCLKAVVLHFAIHYAYTALSGIASAHRLPGLIYL
jgi:hypothetical protein